MSDSPAPPQRVYILATHKYTKQPMRYRVVLKPNMSVIADVRQKQVHAAAQQQPFARQPRYPQRPSFQQYTCLADESTNWRQPSKK